MEKITVPFRGKSYEFNCYATTMENEIIFCCATPDHKPLALLENDHFFVKVSQHSPDRLITGGYANTKEAIALVEAAATVFAERFFSVNVLN